MYVFSHVAEQEQEYMLLKVVHKDVGSSEDVVLGLLPLELGSVMNAPNITTDEWYLLRQTAHTDNTATAVFASMQSDDGGDQSVGGSGAFLRVQMTYMMGEAALDEELDADGDAAEQLKKPNLLEVG